MVKLMYPLNHVELSTEIERLEWNHFNVMIPIMGNRILPTEVDTYLQNLVTYDLVHARLLILALRSVDWTLLVANVRILLRLGCYIFWEDDDLENFKGFPATSNRQRILWPRQSASRCPLGGASGPPYPIGLDRLMTASGFANAHQESIRTSDIWDHPTLSWPTQRMMSTSLTAYLKGIVELGGFADLQTTKDAARKIADLTEETEAGKAILNVWYWRTIAQRPVEGAEGR